METHTPIKLKLGKLIAVTISGLSGRCEKKIFFLFMKINRIIVTQVGFCVISQWSLSGFPLNHKKALLRWLLHLHYNFQVISPRSSPCECDRILTLFYANNQ